MSYKKLLSISLLTATVMCAMQEQVPTVSVKINDIKRRRVYPFVTVPQSGYGIDLINAYEKKALVSAGQGTVAIIRGRAIGAADPYTEKDTSEGEITIITP